MRLIGAFIVLVLVAGCTGPVFSQQGLDIRIDANPSPVFKNSRGQLFIDVANREEKRYTNLRVDVFDTGPYIKSAACSPASFSELRKDVVATTICTFTTDDVNLDKAENTIWTDFHFSSALQEAFAIDVISQREYDLRKKSGTLAAKPRTYTFRDAYLQVDIEFSDDPPLVIGKKSQVAFVTVRNIGDGLVSELPAGSVRITGIVQCEDRTLIPVGAQFPRMTCVVNLPQADFASTHAVTVNVGYSYRLRKSVTVPIIGGFDDGVSGRATTSTQLPVSCLPPPTAALPMSCQTNQQCPLEGVDCDGDGTPSLLECRRSLGVCCYGNPAEQSDADCRRMNRI